MEANLEEIVLDDSVIVVHEGPSKKEDEKNDTITLDDTLESMESTDSKQWAKEQEEKKEEVRKIKLQIEQNQKDIETLKEIQKLEDDIRRTNEIREAIEKTIADLQKTQESSVEESGEEEEPEVDEVFPGEADWDMSLEVMTSPTSSQLLEASPVGSIIMMSPPLEIDDSVVILSPDYAPPPSSPRSPFTSWYPVYPTPETKRRRSSSLSPRRPSPPAAMNGKRRRSSSSSPRFSPRASPISPLTVSLLTTPEGRGDITPPISSSSPINRTRLSTEPRLLRPLQKRHASPPFFGPRPRNIFKDEEDEEEVKGEDGKSGQEEGQKRKREDKSDSYDEERKEEGKEKEETKGEKEKENKEEEKMKIEIKEEEESRKVKSGVWHVDIDSAETVWKQIFRDLEEATRGTNPLLNRRWIKLVNPDHPAIKIRTTYLSWGTRHEDLAPSGPSVVAPMTVECLKTIDSNLIGQEPTPTMENLEVFELELKELQEEEEKINTIVFSTISSYSKGNTSKQKDCLNRLFLTPMEVRWLNLHTNVIMALEGKDVTWPIETHVGLYHPPIFSAWLDRKKELEERKVMSLLDQTRRMIQERINPNLSPYLQSCPCVYWV